MATLAHRATGRKYAPWPDASAWNTPMAQSLSPAEVEQARALYEEFFARHPLLKNPTDINKAEKAQFLIMHGWLAIRLMQRARKQKYEFTKSDEDDADDA